MAVQEAESTLKVARRWDGATDVAVLELADESGEDLPDWSPGAHIDLLLDEGLVRQYSLCGSPSESGTWRVAVLREPESRGGSTHIHERLDEGSTVRVRGPRNHFSLVSSPRYVFIGGGIGVTPLIPMVEAAEASGAHWELTYGGRERASMAFVEQLEGYGDKVTIWPEDQKGLLDLDALLGEPRDDTVVYCCGPEGLLNAVEDKCREWPSGSLHVERFSAKPVPTTDSGDDSEEGDGALDTFEVVCERSGQTVTVTADESVFDALDEAGIDIMTSCLEGTCGTCEAGVVEGEPAHRDSVLSDVEQEANDVMMTCVSRSKTKKLVLDL